MIWSRWSATGNSFYILDAWTSTVEMPSPQSERAATARWICKQFQNAPTDGVLYLDKHDQIDFVWDFYNSDGSSAEMCGNAARCATLYFLERVSRSRGEVVFLTKAGEVSGRRLDSKEIAVTMPKISDPSSAGAVDGYFHTNTGVPHYVVEGPPDMELIQHLRPTPAPRGSNITFLERASSGGGEAVSFERGVEGLTQACGTGAVAAAHFLFERFGTMDVRIVMPGGELRVQNAQGGKCPTLSGAVQWDYELETEDWSKR